MSEPKYIDANELRAMMFHGAFEEDSDLQRWDGGCWIRYKMFENALEQIGAADVVEVVRCAECKYWDRSVLEHQANDFREWDEAECGMLAERDPYHETDHYTEEDDFCSRGERKDG